MNIKEQAEGWYQAADVVGTEARSTNAAIRSIAASLIRIGDLLEKQQNTAEIERGEDLARALYMPSKS